MNGTFGKVPALMGGVLRLVTAAAALFVLLSVALPATLDISDTPARSGVVSRAAARLRIE